MVFLRKKSIFVLLLIAFVGFSCGCENEAKNNIAPPPAPTTGEVPDVLCYLTKTDKSALFAKQDAAALETTNPNLPIVEINVNETFQTIDGFGFTLTGGSAMHIHNMQEAKRSALLTELFDTLDNNIGVSYLRVSLGASDLDAEPFTYNDLPNGETDEEMTKFSLENDRTHLIPVLKQILAINPDIKILASPWSPPSWMKSNNASKGGSLLPKYYQAYAKYFVKYVQEMKKEGITIDAITVQNEPLHPGNNPSLLMEAEDQLVFIKDALGPAFRDNGIATKIIIYDHNADRTDYPITILNDAEARKFIDGSAFHLYGGSINDISKVHIAHPDKNLYFTEQWIGAPGDLANDLKWHAKEVVIGGLRNWCKVVLEWNLAANSALQPHTDGGCTECLGALTIDGNVVVRNPAYYIMAHAAKFIRPGAKRIASNQLADMPNVAFQLADGKLALVVYNESQETKMFTVLVGEEMFSISLSGNTYATYVW